MKKIVSWILAAVLLVMCSTPVLADATKVVTLGADLTPDQQQMMWDYFGVNPNDVVTETVNNQEERQYLSGIAPEEQIGTRTYSSAYIEPTSSGGINVKTANLNWVTADMISSALSTAGVENANVIAAAPFAVSGTGALTGILKSYQTATNTAISEDKQQAANQEIIATTDIADSLTKAGQDATEAKNEATEIVNEAKKELLDEKKNGEVTDDQLNRIVDTVGKDLSDTDKATLLALLQKINSVNYTDSEIKSALNNIDNTLNKLVNGVTDQNNFFQNIWKTIQGWFGGGDILDKTDDAALGAGAVITDTAIKLEDSTTTQAKTSWWDNVVKWWNGLFSSEKKQETTTTTPQQTTDETTTQESTDTTATPSTSEESTGQVSEDQLQEDTINAETDEGLTQPDQSTQEQNQNTQTDSNTQATVVNE